MSWTLVRRGEARRHARFALRDLPGADFFLILNESVTVVNDVSLFVSDTDQYVN